MHGRRTGYHGPCDGSLVALVMSAGEISMLMADAQDNLDGRAKAKGGGLVERRGPMGWPSHRGAN